MTKPTCGFELKTPGLEIQHPNHLHIQSFLIILVDKKIDKQIVDNYRYILSCAAKGHRAIQVKVDVGHQVWDS